MKRITTAQTDFQRIEVWGSDDEVEFHVAGAIHATWHRQRFLTGMAWDAICAASLLNETGLPKNLLMLGLGGGTAVRQLKRLIPNLAVTAVELDSKMISLARKFMHLDKLGIDIHAGDAYTWLKQNKQEFDVIVDDVYGSGELDVMRPTAYTGEMAVALKRSLTPDGIFVANLVTGTGHRKMQGIFRNFFRANFPVVRSIAPPDSLNESLVGGKHLAPPSLLKPYEYIWLHRKDQDLWKRLKCRMI